MRTAQAWAGEPWAAGVGPSPRQRLPPAPQLVQQCNEGARKMERTEQMYELHARLDFGRVKVAASSPLSRLQEGRATAPGPASTAPGLGFPPESPLWLPVPRWESSRLGLGGRTRLSGLCSLTRGRAGAAA